MRKFALLMMVILFASLALAQAAKTSTPASASDGAQLNDIEQKWAQALLKGDIAYMDGITATGYFETMPDATVRNKARLLDDMTSGKTKFESFAISDLMVRVFGDAAVVSGAFTEKGVDNGTAFNDAGRFTDTFIKKDGKWLAVATHVSTKPPAKAAKPAAGKAEKKN